MLFSRYYAVTKLTQLRNTTINSCDTMRCSAGCCYSACISGWFIPALEIADYCCTRIQGSLLVSVLLLGAVDPMSSCVWVRIPAVRSRHGRFSKPVRRRCAVHRSQRPCIGVFFLRPATINRTCCTKPKKDQQHGGLGWWRWMGWWCGGGMIRGSFEHV